jgi:hypothetical protein
VTDRILSFLLAAFLSAGAWANPCATGGRPFPAGDGSGMGGTGHGDGSGSGGTGQQARTDGDGSGTGGTGVVGVITGFGSICVNALEIHYDAKTPVSVNGQSGRAAQLAVGQVVAVRAEGEGANLQARHIQIRHTLVGRVEAVNQAGQFRIWGQWVSPPQMSHVEQGERVKVSGQRVDSTHVVASRIDPAQTGEPDVLSGEVGWSQTGETQVSGVRIRLPEGADRPKPGQEIRASGRPEAGGFRAERIEPDGLRGFMDKMEHLNVKDRIQLFGKPGKLRIGGLEFALDANTRMKGGSAKELLPGRLVQVEARQKNGRAVIERIEFRADGAERNHEKADQGTTKARHGADQDAHDTRLPEKNAQREGQDDHSERSREAVAQGGADRVEGRNEAAEKMERDEKTGRVEKSENVEKPEKIEKPGREEKVEKLERAEKPEKVEKVEKPEKPEKIEKPEKPEKVERPEQPD